MASMCCCFFLPRKLPLQSCPSRLATPSHLNLEMISFGSFQTLQSWVTFPFYELPYIYLMLSLKSWIAVITT